jgi:hypothetical protein
MKSPVQIAVTFSAAFAALNPVFAQTWRQATNAPIAGWTAIASSADGTKLAAGTYNGSIYTSVDSGTTWTTTTVSNMIWLSLASSADGTKLIGGGNYIYTSTDGGLTWISNNVPSSIWVSVACSADGNKLVAAAGVHASPGGLSLGSFGSIYTSTNSGGTWVSNAAPVQNWQSIASSADGNKLVAVAYGSPIYTSLDSGATWTSNNTPGIDWQCVVSSADGSRLAAAPEPGNLYTSTNSGAKWVSNSVSSHWRSVAASADGEKLVAAVGGDGSNVLLATSTNSGVSWTASNIPGSFWSSVTASADGNKLAGTVLAGGIYVYYSLSAPALDLALSDANLSLSWLIPSTDFVLQQSPDLISWSNVTNTPVLNLTNLNNELTLSPSISNGFFRLISQ